MGNTYLPVVVGIGDVAVGEAPVDGLADAMGPGTVKGLVGCTSKYVSLLKTPSQPAKASTAYGLIAPVKDASTGSSPSAQRPRPRRTNMIVGIGGGAMGKENRRRACQRSGATRSGSSLRL